jgi:hypothetical protein
MNAKEELTKLLMESYDQGVKDGLQTSLQLVKERLAQPEQEPVAWIERDMQCDDFDPDSVTCEKPTIAANGWEWVALYTTPPQRTWVGLTQKEVQEIHDTFHKRMGPQEFASMIEAKLKEKNT